MKKLISIKYSAGAFNTGILILRVVGGILLMKHGYGKLVNFEGATQYIPSVFGIGSTFTTVLVIFAEFFCALFVAIGLFTRLAAIPIIINMAYIVFVLKGGDAFNEGHLASLFLTLFITLLFVGPGKISVDGMISK